MIFLRNYFHQVDNSLLFLHKKIDNSPLHSRKKVYNLLSLSRKKIEANLYVLHYYERP